MVNVSEGRDQAVLGALATACGPTLLDLHSDPDHHRSVLTLAGPDTVGAARALATEAVARIDLRTHHGVHPRLGSVDVVPFVALDHQGAPEPEGVGLVRALSTRDEFATWMGEELGVPCFLYGPERSLVELRRQAFSSLAPDSGPPRPHPSAGACAVGARGALVAYNVWLGTDQLTVARAVAAELRGPTLRTLGLATGGLTQVSCNLVDPAVMGPQQVYDAVAATAAHHGVSVARAELVGLLPRAVWAAVDVGRRAQLDLSEERTIEAAMAAAGR